MHKKFKTCEKCRFWKYNKCNKIAISVSRNDECMTYIQKEDE